MVVGRSARSGSSMPELATAIGGHNGSFVMEEKTLVLTVVAPDGRPATAGGEKGLPT